MPRQDVLWRAAVWRSVRARAVPSQTKPATEKGGHTVAKGVPLIEARAVSKDFEGANKTRFKVLSDIQLQIHEGEFVALLGPSGSGKSTLLRIIAGLVPPTDGEVLYRGDTFFGTNPGVSMVFQSFALFPWLTVLENVEMGLRYARLGRDEKRNKAIAVIDMIGLDGFEGAYPKELSGGMRQRVGLGRALVMEPDILLMDEPFSALDVLTAENLKRDLLELWQERKIPTKAIVLVTHSIEEAVYMADRALVLSRDPAKIISHVPITLPHWRERKSEPFTRLVDELYSILTQQKDARVSLQEETEVKLPRKLTLLPNVASGAVTGFIELVDDLGGKVDLYKIGDSLALDLEDLLPIVETCRIFGFGTVTSGDFELTDVGRQVADATVLDRKTMFREQALQHVPFMERILWVLESKRNSQMPREFFLEILQKSVGEEEAETQLDTLISWGRYVELFAYDEDSKLLYLEDVDETQEGGE